MRILSAGKTSVDKPVSRHSEWGVYRHDLATVTPTREGSATAHSSEGYTLLELLVVLIIISLVSALVAPKLAGSLGSLNFKTASKKLSASLRYARSQATSEKITYGALLQMEKNRLLIIADPPVQPESLDEILSDEQEQIDRASLVYELPSEIKIEKAVSIDGEVATDGLFCIFFFPSGGSSGGRVELTNAKGRRSNITVDFITGSVKIKD
jgi:general secretion pathway protein H